MLAEDSEVASPQGVGSHQTGLGVGQHFLLCPVVTLFLLVHPLNTMTGDEHILGCATIEQWSLVVVQPRVLDHCGGVGVTIGG